MESKTHTKPRILFTGAPTANVVNVLREVGDVTVGDGASGVEHAEVLWVDGATAAPHTRQHLYRAALEAGKTLVLTGLDAATRKAVEGVLPVQLGDTAPAVMITRDTTASTPHSYTITPLDDSLDAHPAGGAPSGAGLQLHSGGPLDAAAPQVVSPGALERERGWASALRAHQQRTNRSVGSPGLIPPSGVLYGVSTFNRSYNYYLSNSHWSSTSGKQQTAESSFISSFYVYRENGKASTDYVVIRIQEATFSPGTLMVRTDNAKGFWQFELQTECTNNRQTALITANPGTTNGPGVSAQTSVPLNVKYVQDGSCVPNIWNATHNPIVRSIEGWGLQNRSSMSAGRATWYFHQRDVWNPVTEPPSDFGRWWAQMFEGGYGGRVKVLTALAGSAFTVETACAWRFSASTVASSPNVTFTEKLSVNFASFANPSGTGNGHHQIVNYTSMLERSDSHTINLVNLTDIASPCK